MAGDESEKVDHEVLKQSTGYAHHPVICGNQLWFDSTQQ